MKLPPRYSLMQFVVKSQQVRYDLFRQQVSSKTFLCLVLLCFVAATIFSKLSNAFLLVSQKKSTILGHRVTPRHLPCLFLSQESIDTTARAGVAGYSVSRRPASWDPSKDPEFDIPDSLFDEDQSSKFKTSAADVDWWSNRNAQKETKQQDKQENNDGSIFPSVLKSGGDGTLKNVVSETETLDLFRRTLETLDFLYILRALQDECTTAPARLIIQDARDRTMNSTATKNKGGFDMKFSKNAKRSPETELHYRIANQQLLADTVHGSQDRYHAVQEMTWLLNGGIIMDLVDLDTCTWRNRLGYRQSLAGRPAPLGGNGFNLESMLDGTHNGRRVLEGYEILSISDMLDIMEDIILWNRNGLQKVDQVEFKALTTIADCINVNVTLQDLLHNAFEQSEKGSMGQRRLSGITFPKIGELRSRVRSLKADIMTTLNDLVTLPSMKSKLALESGGALISEVGNGSNGGRLVIPVTAQYASKIGIVHDTSRSGKTVYCEPTEIVEPTNKLRQAESELRMEESRVWRMLTEQIILNHQQLEISVAAVGQLDLVYAKCLLGLKLKGTIPQVHDEGIISLYNARHPVLMLRKNINVVGSTIQLGSGANQGVILTGPNAGGKTVILKLIGLVALMARCGIPIPADTATTVDGSSQHVHVATNSIEEESMTKSAQTLHSYKPRVDFFNPVLADIGDLQSVGSDLSTFSGHMLVCREVLNNAGKNALVLMDELGSGTDPAQGVAIAQALLEALVERGCRVAITTHYLQLKQLAASDERFSVAGMQFVKGKPTYKLLPGIVGESFALAVAERLELPRSIIDRATELLDTETRQMGDLLRDLEDQKAVLDERVAMLEEKAKEMEAMELKMKEELIKMEKKQLSIRREEARKFSQKLEEKEKILEDVLEKLKSDPSRRIVAKSWDDIKFVKRDAMNEAENLPSIQVRRREEATSFIDSGLAELVPLAELRDLPELKPGDKLVVCKPGPLFGREGHLVQAMGNKVEVRVNNMNVSLKLTQVSFPVGNKASFASFNNPSNDYVIKGKSTARAAERAIASEGSTYASKQNEGSQSVSLGSTITMRTISNTVDVLGCNLMEAQERIKQKFSSSLASSRKIVYILHGHGTGGVLKTKIRAWLKQESKLVKNFSSADRSDGGDAFTRVELH